MAQVAVVIDFNNLKCSSPNQDYIPDEVRAYLNNLVSDIIRPALRERFKEAFRDVFIDGKYDRDTWVKLPDECSELADISGEQPNCSECIHRLACTAIPPKED